MKTELATFGGGCFWCLDAAFQQLKGIKKVTSGFAGGHVPAPSYEAVCSGTTGHAEVVQLEYDPDVIAYGDLLDIFWTLHDPTTRNRQGNDVGTQYRSVIFYGNETQKHAAQKSIKSVQKLWQDKIVTELKPLIKFYPAESYHQNYYAQNSDQAYCQVVINPKLATLRRKFATRLK